jgi:hypothetical protein
MYPLTAKRMVRPEEGAVSMPFLREPAPDPLRLVTK